MANNLSFSVAINLLTENFKKGSQNLKNGLRDVQMQAMSLFAALGAGSIGLSSFVTDLIAVARETSRVSTVLKNVSGDTKTYAKNQEFLIGISKKYGLYINDLMGNYAGFSAAANGSNMSMKDQQKIFESLSKAAVNFGMSSDQANGMFLAVQQMMSKGKISAEELRGQLGERLPIAMQAMARAAGVSISALGDLMKEGKLLSADVLPKFADALNDMMGNINTDTVESSINKIKNSFQKLATDLNVSNLYKNLLGSADKAIKVLTENFKTFAFFFVNIISTIIIAKGIKMLVGALTNLTANAYKAFYQANLIFVREMGAGFVKSTFLMNRFANVMKFALGNILRTFAPLLLISGIVAIIQKLTEYIKKQKEIREIWSNYQKDLKNASGNSDEIVKMNSLLRIMNNKKENQNIINKAQSDLLTMLGLEKGTQQEINEEVKKRIKLFKDSAKAGFLANRIVEGENKINELATSKGIRPDQAQDLVKLYVLNGKNQGTENYSKLINKLNTFENNSQFKTFAGGFNKNEIYNFIKEIAGLNAVNNNANKELDKTFANSGTTKTPTKPDKDPDKPKPDLTDIQKAEKEYTDNLTELNNQLNNSVINQETYNEKIDELNKTSFEKIGGLLTPEKALKNQTFLSAKKGVENPLIDQIQKKYIEEQKKYNDSLSILNKKKDLELITADEYTTEFNNLIDSTVENILTIEDIKNAGDEYIKNLKKLKKDIVKPIEKDLSSYNYKSPYDKIGKSETENLEIDLESAKSKLTQLLEDAKDGTKDLTEELGNQFQAVFDIDKALNIAKIKKTVKDLQKELNSGLYDGVKNIADSAKNLYEAFQAVKDTINDVDASGWDKFLAIWDALTNSIDSIMSMVSLIETLTTLTNALGVAKKTEAVIDTATTAVKTANATTQVNANIATATTGAAASTSFIPIIGVGLAIAGVAAIIATLSNIPKFATGGIVGGNSTSGDTILARLNSGEMVLNKGQQSTLFGMLKNGGGSGNNGGQVEFKIEGKALKGVLNNFEKIKSKS